MNYLSHEHVRALYKNPEIGVHLWKVEVWDTSEYEEGHWRFTRHGKCLSAAEARKQAEEAWARSLSDMHLLTDDHWKELPVLNEMGDEEFLREIGATFDAEVTA